MSSLCSLFLTTFSSRPLYLCQDSYYFFFFSSRRRHTRYWRDWSSDVCSSDLKSTDNGNGHRTPHLGTLPASGSHRYHTEHGRSGSHQYRTKTALARCDHGVQHRHAPFTTKRNIIDKHNTVLYHNTDEHDGPKQTHHTQGTSRKEQCHEYTAERKGQREHDNERIGQRFELGSHYNKYKDNNQKAQRTQVTEGVLLVFIRTRHLNADPCRNIHFIDDSLSRFHDIS